LAIVSTFAFAQERVNTQPIPVPSTGEVKIRVPRGDFRRGQKVRIRNLMNGRSRIITLDDEEFLASSVVRELVGTEARAEFLPEFSVLRVDRTVALPQKSTEAYSGLTLEKALVLEEPRWKLVGFTAKQGASGVSIQLDPYIVNLAPDALARSRSLSEDLGLKRLFELGWIAARKGRYDIALQAFDRILRTRGSLDAAAVSQAHLGRAISRFHQEGCTASAADFAKADENRLYSTDVTYYRALCFSDAKKYEEARELFREVARGQDLKYAEAARFYLGALADFEDRFDEAEAAYLDTIDFSKDARLVATARDRMERLRARQAAHRLNARWLLASLTLGAGYDSNVTSEAQQSFRATNQASVSQLGVGLLGVKLPWTPTFSQQLSYSLLVLHYTKASLVPENDAQNHQLSTKFVWEGGARNRFELEGGYNSLYLGQFRKAGEYLAGPFASALFEHRFRREVSSFGFRATVQNSKRAAVTPDFDVDAQDYILSFSHQVPTGSGDVFGPKAQIEYRNATGREIAFVEGVIGGYWNINLGQPAHQFRFTQEGTYGHRIFHHQIESRRDDTLTYRAALIKGIGRHLDARLQFDGELVYSTLTSRYQYHKATGTLLVSAFF